MEAAEKSLYTWQAEMPGFGEQGQQRLKDSSVLISRIGGVGGLVAYELAAAGVGRLVLAHAGNLRADDLNRQLLMRHDGIGQPRTDLAARRLKELNPYLHIDTLEENLTPENAERHIRDVDVVVSCAPLFTERLAMNATAVRLGKPLVDCAMYEWTIQVISVLPGRSPCLACLYSEAPPAWQRRFPVFGAVSGVAGCLGATEVIKLLTGLGEPLTGRLLLGDLHEMRFDTVRIARRPGCEVCGTL